MNATIIWTKGDTRSGAFFTRIQITDTVIATVRAIGKGQITVANVLWSINSQLSDGDADRQLTERQVARALTEISRRQWLRLSYNGHGVYRWS